MIVDNNNDNDDNNDNNDNDHNDTDNVGMFPPSDGGDVLFWVREGYGSLFV